MKYVSLILVCLIFSCQAGESKKTAEDLAGDLQQTGDTLYRFGDGEYELGTPAGFKDAKGKVIIAKGKYSQIWTDKWVDYAIVSDAKNTGGKIVAIDKNEKILFEVYWFDNGPDYTAEGLFRVKQDGKTGYANEKGEIVIPCKYDCADPFENGKARVALKCEKISDGEHTSTQSDNWIYIDKTGKVTK